MYGSNEKRRVANVDKPASDGRCGPQFTLEALESRRLLSSAGNSSISGTVYQDIYGHFASATVPDPVLFGRQVFLDLLGTGFLAAGDPVTTTGGDGTYTFSGLPAGRYTVRIVSQSNDGLQIPVGVETPLAGKYTVRLKANQNITGENFLAVGFSAALRTVAHGKTLTLTELGAPVFGQHTMDLRRFNADGGADTHFGRHGAVHVLDLNENSAAIDILSLHRDGSVIVGGVYGFQGGLTATNGLTLTLVNASGHIVRAVNVSSFHEAGPFVGDVWQTTTATADGKIVVAGLHFDNGVSTVIFERFNADLRPDKGFGFKGRIETQALTTVPQSIASGPGTSLTLTYPNSTDQLNADGSVVPIGPAEV
jgi:hypothetical protein